MGKKSKKKNNKLNEMQMLEYEKAQDSAEHYNIMVWTLISIIFAFSLLILRTILLDINSSGWTFSLVGKFTVINGLLLIGTLSWVYFGYLIEGADEKKKWKHFICQEIEKRNKDFFGQNLGVEHLPFAKNKFGLTFFIITKNVFIIFFLFISILAFIKSLDTDELIWVKLILIIHIIIFIIYSFFQCKCINNTKKIKYEKILSGLK